MPQLIGIFACVLFFIYTSTVETTQQGSELFIFVILLTQIALVLIQYFIFDVNILTILNT